MECLLLRKTSIRKLGANHKFGWSSKSIERGINDGEISPELMNALAQHLNVDTDYLSGKYHKPLEMIKDESVRYALKVGLKAEKFPYILHKKRIKYDGKFLYDRYLEDILVIHGISIHRFDEMQFEKQKSLKLDLEDAIVNVLIKYFPNNELGQDNWTEINSLWYEIENYDPNEKEIGDSLIFEEDDDNNHLESKYAYRKSVEEIDYEN